MKREIENTMCGKRDGGEMDIEIFLLMLYNQWWPCSNHLFQWTQYFFNHDNQVKENLRIECGLFDHLLQIPASSLDSKAEMFGPVSFEQSL